MYNLLGVWKLSVSIFNLCMICLRSQPDTIPAQKEFKIYIKSKFIEILGTGHFACIQEAKHSTKSHWVRGTKKNTIDSKIVEVHLCPRSREQQMNQIRLKAKERQRLHW